MTATKVYCGSMKENHYKTLHNWARHTTQSGKKRAIFVAINLQHHSLISVTVK